jgi:hypothetical protein
MRVIQFAVAVVLDHRQYGLLDRPVPATPRLRRGFIMLARRSFSEGGKPGDDGCGMGDAS